MSAMLLAVFVASLLGSLHCAGMCGPFVAFIMGGSADDARAIGWRVAGAYHAGRLVTYAMLGAVMGLIGAAVDLGGAMAGVAHAAAIIAGATMVVVGGSSMLRAMGWSVGAGEVGGPPSGWRRGVMSVQRLAMKLTPTRRALAIGLMSTLLPCGWLWAFAATAGATASVWSGTLVMVAFWLGTLPVLLGLGVGLHALRDALATRLPVITAAVVLVAGISMIGFRVSLTPHAAPPPMQTTTNGQPAVPTTANCH